MMTEVETGEILNSAVAAIGIAQIDQCSHLEQGEFNHCPSCFLNISAPRENAVLKINNSSYHVKHVPKISDDSYSQVHQNCDDRYLKVPDSAYADPHRTGSAYAIPHRTPLLYNSSCLNCEISNLDGRILYYFLNFYGEKPRLRFKLAFYPVY